VGRRRSSWSAVIEQLQTEGYTVTAPQFPESSLADDVARLRQVLNRQDGPAVVAAHSYGGQIMTALGTDAPNVVGLVYIAAFGLDEGESIGGLLAQGGPPTPALAHLDIDKLGFAWLPEDDLPTISRPMSIRSRAGHVRRAAASGRVHVPGRDGRPGLEITPVLVPGRRRGSGHPARR
jgi:pimeloyl-ACP methyl ester carboxylesterase